MKNIVQCVCLRSNFIFLASVNNFFARRFSETLKNGDEFFEKSGFVILNVFWKDFFDWVFYIFSHQK